MFPREKFLERGVDSLTVKDLLAIILSSGVKGRNYKQLSSVVFEKLRVGAEYKDLIKIKGLGSVKAMQIVASIEIGRRLNGIQVSRKVISSTQLAYEEIQYISRYKREHLVGLFLNARYELLGKKVVAIGSLDRISVLPRDVIVPALYKNAAYVLLGHNHPSGGVSPSNEDVLFTKRVKKALEIVGIVLLDHIVITEDSFCRVELG